MYLVDTMIGRTCSVPYDPKSTNKLVHACNVMLQKRENAVILNWTF